MSEQRWLTHGGPIVERVDISPTNFVLAVDETRQMSAIATYSGGTTLDVTGSVEWSSDDESVATVDAAGLVTGAAVGSTAIRATLGPTVGGASVIVLGVASGAEWFFVL